MLIKETKEINIGLASEFESGSVLDDSLELFHSLLSISVGELIEDLGTSLGLFISVVQSSLTSDSSCQDEVLLHDGHSVCMDGTQVCVLKESN